MADLGILQIVFPAIHDVAERLERCFERGIEGHAREVFRETTCGLCGSEQVAPSHRVAKGYDFYSMDCLGCGATLSFGQTREGERLFPKRRDKEGNEVGKSGWHQYQHTQQEGF